MVSNALAAKHPKKAGRNLLTSLLVYPYGFIDWHSDFVNLPFMLKVRVPPTDRGKRGYSDVYVSKARALTVKE